MIPLTYTFISADSIEQLILLQLSKRYQTFWPGLECLVSKYTTLPSPGSVRFATSFHSRPLLIVTIKNWSMPPLNPDTHVKFTLPKASEYPVKFSGVWGLSWIQNTNNISKIKNTFTRHLLSNHFLMTHLTKICKNLDNRIYLI